MKKPGIMIVEDESITALSIKNSVEEMGYAVTSISESGEEAVKNALKDKPDLILMDITLSGTMDGTEAARTIRSRLKIPVVYLTAHTDDKIFQQAKITAPFGYIVKPFDDRELEIAIEIALYKHKMESALRESRMKYSTLFKTAADSIYLIDARTQRIVDCNPKAVNITGYTARQLKTMTISELHPREEQDVVAAIFSKIDRLRTLSGISGISQMSHDGRLVPVEINATRVNINGMPYYLGIFRDITARKKAENALLRETNKLVNILNAMDDGVYITNKEYIIEYVNPSFRKDFGAAQGRTCSDYFHGQKETCPICKNTDVFKGNTVHWEWTSPQGKSYDIIETPMTNADGSISKLSIFRDVSDRKEIEKQLQDAALIDVLTGLLNRRGFFTYAEQRIRLAHRTGENLSLLYLDMDNLKTINDSIGHKAGDSALIDAADIIRKTFRESDIIARIGGDEFAVLLTKPSEQNDERIIIDHLQNNITLFNARGERDYKLLLSAGMTHWVPGQPRTIDEMLSKADALMYVNKKQRKLYASNERRCHNRLRTGKEYRAQYNGSGMVPVRDISPGGTCLEMTEQPETGATYEVHIFKNDDDKISATGQIVWHSVDRASTGKYIAGIKFTKINSSSVRSLIADI